MRILVRYVGKLCFAYFRTQNGGPVLDLWIGDRSLATLTLDEVPRAVANGVEHGELRDVGLIVDTGGRLVRFHRGPTTKVPGAWCEDATISKDYVDGQVNGGRIDEFGGDGRSWRS